jgi:hypothetical protein
MAATRLSLVVKDPSSHSVPVIILLQVEQKAQSQVPDVLADI